MRQIPKGTLWQVVLSYACFGIVTRQGRVVFAAPIGRWMIGKRLAFVSKYVKSKHGRLKLAQEVKR